MGGRIEATAADGGKEGKSHDDDEASSLVTLLRSWAKAGVESKEFSEPESIPAEPAGLSPC